LFSVALMSIIFAVLFLGSWHQSRKTRHRQVGAPPKVLLLIMWLFLVWLLLSQYAITRPYVPISIVSLIVNLFVVTCFLGALAILFLRDLRVWTESNFMVLLFRLGLVLYGYVLAFAVVGFAFGYAFVSIVDVEKVAATPEFVGYVLPTLAGIVLVAYRLSNQFRIEALDFIRRIPETIIYASFVVFLYVASVNVVGAPRVRPFGPIAPDLPTGLFIGLVGLGVEYVLHRIRTGFDLSRAAPVKLWKEFNLEAFLLSVRRSITQSTLDDFQESHVVKKRSWGSKLSEQLDGHCSVTLLGRTLRGTLMIELVLVAAAAPVIFFSAVPVRADIMAPAYSATINVTDVSGIANLPIYRSDQIEFKGATDYAVPLVKVI